MPLTLWLAVLSTALCLCEGGRINVVLLGATGNLAEKYLWQGLFNIDLRGIGGSHKDKMYVYPAATKPSAMSAPILERILKNNITAKAIEDPIKGKERIEEFLARVHDYVQLKTDEDFATLAKTMEIENTASGEEEVGRMLYLSVPPQAFGSIAASINKHLRPSASGAWLRVIIEKPFGVDLASAQELAQGIYKSLKAEEVLLVDHYMGKEIMDGIRMYRKHNPKTIRQGSVLFVDVAMLETDDAKGRTGFYDGVGVLRDTMQNHLMMMLALVGMDYDALSSGTASEPELRRKFFEGLSPANLENTMLGQYVSYNQHVGQDKEKWGEKPSEKASKTPTFAHVFLDLDYKESPLHNVGIALRSGKALDVRRSYIDVHLVNGGKVSFNLQGPTKEVDMESDPLIYQSYDLGKFQSDTKNGWRCISFEPRRGYVSFPPETLNAYEKLLRDALEGRVESFVSLDEVLASWKVWSPLLSEIEAKGDDLDLMQYDHGWAKHQDLLFEASEDVEEEEKDEL